MRHVTKNLSARSGQMGLIALLACTLATQISFASTVAEEPVTPDELPAPAMVLNDQYKFTQLNYTPFVIDQFSGFDYTGYKVYKVCNEYKGIRLQGQITYIRAYMLTNAHSYMASKQANTQAGKQAC